MSKDKCVGIDVSAKTLCVAWRDNRQRERVKDYPNTAAGHKRLTRDLGKVRPVRVALEATGVYHLDVAMFLHEAESFSVMVVNPKASHNFGKAMLTRNKTDPVDAVVLLEFCERMPWEQWRPPSRAAFELRSLSRHGTSLRLRLAAEKTRLKQCDAVDLCSRLVREDVAVGIAELTRRIERNQGHALVAIAGDKELERQFALLQSVVGFGEVAGVQLLSELAVLPADMSAKQWVAHAGLDPRRHESGTSVHRPSRISKVGNRYVRRSLYMPALVASQRDEHVAGFYQHLVAAGKPRKVAVVAVMRKLLHAVWGIFRSGQPWDPSRFYRLAVDAEKAVVEELAPSATQNVAVDEAETAQSSAEVQVGAATATNEAAGSTSGASRAEQEVGLGSAEVGGHHITSLRRSAAHAQSRT